MDMYAQPRTLDHHLPGGEPGTSVVVEPLRVGELNADASVLGGGTTRLATRLRIGGASKRLRVPVNVYLVHHPVTGPLLIDTGLHASVAASAEANMGRRLVGLLQPHLPDNEILATQLRQRGLEPGDIHTVVLTHLHADTASGISGFPHATLVVSEPEWRAASGEDSSLPAGYHHPHYDYAFDYRLVDYDASYISSYGSFGRTFDLFGDGSVRLVFTPGHSPGHQSVLCRLRDRDLVLTGDALMTAAELEGEDPAAPAPDRHIAERSRRELLRFAGQFPDAHYLPSRENPPPDGARYA